MIRTSRLFAQSGLITLCIGLLFGLIAAIQFISPDFLSGIPFYKARPLHVSLVVSWIFSVGISACYSYLEEKSLLRFKTLSLIHWGLYNITFVGIIISFFLGSFGGREYWAFAPAFVFPILLSWILFAIIFFASVIKVKDWPVYLWMWATGIIIFIYTFCEANTWTIDYFSNSAVREISIQWKAYGSLVGSWNMLVYGTAIYLMEKISQSDTYSKSRIAFILYFIGLTNLFFNWAHHVYPVPLSENIRLLAYGISMTELLILGRIIWKWKSNLQENKAFKNMNSYALMVSSDFWVFFNLLLAILISIPVINFFIHGTHVVVAHAMGSTIGINSLILFAYLYYHKQQTRTKLFNTAYHLTNWSLGIFLTGLILSGTLKGMARHQGENYYQIVQTIEPYIHSTLLSGCILFIGITLLIISYFRSSQAN